MWSPGQDRLHPDVVAPAVGQVVLVQEALANPETEGGEADRSRVVGEAEAASVADAVFAPVDKEAVEVVVAPVEDELQGGVKFGDRAVAADQDPAPDQRADAVQHHPELVDDRTGRRGFRHPAILLLITSEALCLPRIVPVSKSVYQTGPAAGRTPAIWSAEAGTRSAPAMNATVISQKIQRQRRSTPATKSAIRIEMPPRKAPRQAICHPGRHRGCQPT